MPGPVAEHVARLPPVSSLFASLLGYNPLQRLLGPATLHDLPPAQSATLTGHSFFPTLMSRPFSDALTVAFGFSAAVCLVPAAASWLRGGMYHHPERELPASQPARPRRPVPVDPGRWS
jgi:hypothetical protein